MPPTRGFARNTRNRRGVFRIVTKSGCRCLADMGCVWTEWERYNECDNLSETIRLRDIFPSTAKGGRSA